MNLSPHSLHVISWAKGKKGKLQRQKPIHPLEYCLDLLLEGPVEDAVNVRKQCRERDFPRHLFSFVIIIGLTKYGAI